MLDELNEGHSGMSRTRSMARSYMWWPNMDRDIESRVEQCEICQMTRHSPATAPLHPWQWPEKNLGIGYISIMQVHSWVRCF